jgi:hypothetical protein
MDNVIAALGQSNRVRLVRVTLASWQLEHVSATMQVPFPELTDLQLFLDGSRPAIPIPASFLGGSAPSLRYFGLSGILFPGLTKLLFSATTHLVKLRLVDIPHSGYISPEEIVALLSALPSLDTLFLEFQSPRLPFGWQSRILPPTKRSILPALNKFRFKGVPEYLEELLARIDAPQLNSMRIFRFDFDCPRLARFIDRTPALRALDEARVIFGDVCACVKLGYRTFHSGLNDFRIEIVGKNIHWQLPPIVQLCNSPLPPLSTVEDLYIEHKYSHKFLGDDAIESTLWLQLLLPFTMVGNLYLSRESAPGIAAALQELVEDGITEVLPSLQNIFVEGLEESGPVPENIGRFVAARQLSENPVTISDWNG